MGFVDRRDAGRRLGERLQHLRGTGLVVLGLPRGGVPVAFEVARALDAPLDVIVVRKLGVPSQPELGMGAVGEDGVLIVNDEVVRIAGVTQRELELVEARERTELERRARRFRGNRYRHSLHGRTALIIDDGIATGSTARAACQVARAHGAERVVLAVPVAPPDWEVRIDEADELIALETPAHFSAIGQFYDNFTQVSDDEVVECLDHAVGLASEASSARASAAETGVSIDHDVEIETSHLRLAGRLTVPAHATGIVVFAHGSGSSRLSPRNRYVADLLNQAGLGTLLFDLLTRSEEQDRTYVFDVALLARRLADVTRALQDQPRTAGLRIGYFGASTGAAAALRAAAEPGLDVAAVVSRGGRPDLAGNRLAAVTAPTLLIVGGLDHAVLDLNRRAQAMLRCENHLTIIEGATHLFEEPGTLHKAAEAARDWFTAHLAATAQPVP